MGYTHYFSHIKDVPDEQWNLLREKVSEAFRWLQPSGIPSFYSENNFTICNGPGDKVILDAQELFQTFNAIEHILFNGDASLGLDHETFFVGQKRGGDDFAFCKTNRKPYDWFVVTVLILMHNTCPGCFRISSDGGAKDWTPILKWLIQRSGIEYLMPMAVISDTFS